MELLDCVAAKFHEEPGVFKLLVCRPFVLHRAGDTLSIPTIIRAKYLHEAQSLASYIQVLSFRKTYLVAICVSLLQRVEQRFHGFCLWLDLRSQSRRFLVTVLPLFCS